jgi:hypothetical protein
VFYKKNDKDETLLIAVCHVNDTQLCGLKSEIQWFKTEIKRRFKIKELGRLKKHLGIWYEWLTDENGEVYIQARMPKLVDEIIKVYEDHVEREAKISNTPGTPGESLPKNTGEMVNEEKYRLIVGKIMYLVTKLFLEGSNPAREMAKHFSNPGEAHWKEVERFVGYMKGNIDEIKLTYRKPREMRVMAMVDSNYATNKDDRRSVSGAIYTTGGTITNWMSKTQPSVTLSSTEAEHYSMVSAVQEIRFTQMMLGEIFESIEPAIIFEDNTGAIFLVKNHQVGQRTKHIDIRYHYLREHVENGNLFVIFVRSEDNESDLCTKNVTVKILLSHVSHIRNGTIGCWRNWKNITLSVWKEDVEDVEGRTSDGRPKKSSLKVRFVDESCDE